MSLSQADFRKLLATPRAPTDSDNKQKNPGAFAKPHPKKPASEFARPVPHKFRKKQDFNQDDEEDESSAKFRDRARERRQGINPDYADSEQIIAKLASTEEANSNKIYEQSKFLGGDISHTHLVKGLDFALLKKVKSELKQTGDHKNEEADVEEFLDKIATQESVPQRNQSVEDADIKPEFNSSLAEQIYTSALLTNKVNSPLTNEMFRAGRMAFCWDLRGGEDIPTNIIRSKAEVRDEVKSSTADSEIVIGKIVEILASVRFGTRSKEGLTVGEKKALKKKEREEKEAEELKNRAKDAESDQPPPVTTENDDDDIFADAGRDYNFETAIRTTDEATKPAPPKLPTTNPLKSTTYFAKPAMDSDDEAAPSDPMHVSTILAPAASANKGGDDDDDMFATLDDEAVGKETPSTQTASSSSSSATLTNLLASSAAMLNTLQGAGTAEKLLVQEHHSLGKSKKPQGLSLSRTTASVSYGEEDPEFDQYYDSDDNEDEDEAAAVAADTAQLDLGIKARKRTQMKRFDFETEEEFQRYKESQVVMPKSAYQFGVKSSDGRKNRKQLSGGGSSKGGNAEQRLDKEMKQLDKMMGEKYGMSISKNEKKREGGGGAGGPKKKRI